MRSLATTAILIPCYNEEERLRTSTFSAFIIAKKNLIDFYFINDGSTDNTSLILKRDLDIFPNCFLIDLEKNHGKGNAIREAYMKIKSQNYKFYGFIDADLQIPLEQLLKLSKGLESNQHSLAVSTRSFGRFKVTNVRSIGSRIIVFFANSIIEFDPRLSDTQCGCKMMTREVAETSFKEVFISNWLFDIEIFLRFRLSDLLAREKIVEVPVEGLGKGEKSKFKLGQSLRIIIELHTIKSFYRVY